MSRTENNVTGKQYWRSLDELENNPQFEQWLHREFQDGATELDGSSRRTLLKLMAASFGLAGLTACRRPAETILPAVKGVEDYVPGNPLYYNTAFSLGGTATGLTVETHDGRPTKVEGNPAHPASKGAASALAQASVLGLYDPDRSKYVLHNGTPASWEEFEKFAKAHFAKLGQGAKLRFLSETVNSPSLAAVRAQALEKFPEARWYEYDTFSDDSALGGAEQVFGEPLRAHYHFDKADVILSLDADFLGLESPAVAWTRDFSGRRRVKSEQDTMNRLYIAESQFSLTGAMADHRLRMRSADVAEFAIKVARAAGVLPEPLKVLTGEYQKWISVLVKDLEAAKGRSLVIAGPRQPAEVHAVAFLLNAELGNLGETVTFTRTNTSSSGFRPQVALLRELAGDVSRGDVDTIVLLGGNPVFTAPADLFFDEVLEKIPVSIHVGIEADETAALAKWHVPQAHYLESWGDTQSWDGTSTIQQPMIQPLFGGRTEAEVVALLTGYPDQRPYDIVHNYWTAKLGGEKHWRKALHDGVIAETKFAEVKPAANRNKVVAMAASFKGAAPVLEVAFLRSASVWDGRFANNGWMQEAPDPMTKLVWDNAALISPATARTLSVKTGDLIQISRGGLNVTAPVLVQPGQADSSIGVAMGYGRKLCGRVGANVGFSPYPLRSTDALGFATSIRVDKVSGTHSIAQTQEHHSMEGRPLVREASIEEYRKEPEFAEKAAEVPELFSLWKEHKYEHGNQWGMVIDLNACTGCNACLVACQAENNIPIVGKEQVIRGREMHWIRMDRYFTGEENEPEAVFQPIACQQCEDAPCESVCPVAATSHSPEGLNDMAYNRCVGTRYCANNCPYKVRRFNFLDWHKGTAEVQKMAYNPDVTVRMRGVMEKCTYCVQRIEETKIRANADGRRPIRDGEILTACQQTCPADAIVFGNLNDPKSKVSQMRKQNRDYHLLAELNVRPRTSFLAKLRNPNPELVNG